MTNFHKIIQFYLLECPVRTYRKVKRDTPSITEDQPHPKYRYEFSKVSKKGRTFDERELGGAKLNTLRAAMNRVADIHMEAVNEMPEDIEQIMAESNVSEYIVYINNDHVSKTEGYFYFIRNAFAHGEYEVENGWYKLENHKKGKLRGTAWIREKTLLKWMELADMTVGELKVVGR